MMPWGSAAVPVLVTAPHCELEDVWNFPDLFAYTELYILHEYTDMISVKGSEIRGRKTRKSGVTSQTKGVFIMTGRIRIQNQN